MVKTESNQTPQNTLWKYSPAPDPNALAGGCVRALSVQAEEPGSWNINLSLQLELHDFGSVTSISKNWGMTTCLPKLKVLSGRA